MKRISQLIGITTVLLMLVGTSEAQSKRELKKIKERQELVVKTTKDDGSRFFCSKLGTVRADIRSCKVGTAGISVDMMVWNNSTEDAEFTFIGTTYAFRNTIAEDDLGTVYKGSTKNYFSFSSNRFEGTYSVSKPIFVPANAPLRVTMNISHVNKEAKMFKNLKFLFMRGELLYEFEIADLTIER